MTTTPISDRAANAQPSFFPEQDRFLVIVSAPRYGARDEFLRMDSDVIATARTEGWARHLLSLTQAQFEGPDYEVEVDILDRKPSANAAPTSMFAPSDVWGDGLLGPALPPF